MTTKIIKNPLINYENKWVAITPDYSNVIESADQPKELEKKLIKQKIKNVILMKVSPFKYISP
jgi:hypothetical protein